MKNQKRWEDISAYFDGEMENPAKIERLLAEDADAKGRLASIQNLSQQIQSLPEPEIHHSMAPRVIARLENAPTTTVSWWFRVGTPLVTAASLAVVVAVTALSMLQSSDVPTNVPATTLTAAEEPLVEEDFETPYVAAADTSWMFSDRFRQASTPEPKDQEAMYLNLASIDWFDVSPYIAQEGYSDMRSTLNDMSERETEVLLLLMTDYAREESAL